MSANKPRKKKRLPIFWIIFLSSVVVFLLLLVFQPERETVEPTHLPWNSYYDEQGNLNALGLKLNHSTLNDVMRLYGKDVEVKMFSDINESNKSIEAYFPVMYIGSIKAAIALRLDVDMETLDSTFEAGKKITMSQSGGREVELYSTDVAKFLDTTFSSITLVPRKHLTDRAIETRFGKADRSEVQSDGLLHLFFNEKGLEMIVDEEGPEALQFSQTIKPI